MVQTIQREFWSRGAKTDTDVAKSIGSPAGGKAGCSLRRNATA
jgi:hypothetical protein